MASGGDIRYARCAGGIDIAYKVMGDGPIDIVFVPGFVSHLDLLDDVPFYCNPVDDMARFARVVMFDKRGTGLSDRSLGFGSFADRMDDIRAVMDAAGIERAALYGSLGGRSPRDPLRGNVSRPRDEALPVRHVRSRLIRLRLSDRVALGSRRGSRELPGRGLGHGEGPQPGRAEHPARGDADRRAL